MLFWLAIGWLTLTQKTMNMYKVYPFVETKKTDARGESPVYLIVSKKGDGKFWLSTGLTSRGKLDGVSFSKGTLNSRARTTMLMRMIADTESVLNRRETAEMEFKDIKSLVMSEVFGIDGTRAITLAEHICDFANTKRASTRTLYNITKRKVEEFDAKAVPDKIDAQWLERFRQWCLSCGMKTNGAAKELRNIRAVFNWARRKGRVREYPFLDYSIVEEETRPNNISVEELRMLRDYPCEEWQRKYIDFFMLSFYLAGINPVDLLSLRQDAMSGGHIRFVRRKTDKEGVRKIRTVQLPVVEEAMEIIKKYPSKDGFLLGFMDGRADYHSFVKKCNSALKKVGGKKIVKDKIGRMRKVEYSPILPNITLYTARYTFGSIAANDLDISERTIGMCLGHSWSKNVTARYMAHDQKKVDLAVRRVAEFVR